MIRSLFMLMFFFVGSGLSFVASASDIYDYKMKSIDGKVFNFSSLKGKVALIVNTASKCGYTGQLEGLETIYKKYKGKGLVVVGVPSDSFNQELSSEKKVADFCKFNYGVSFPMTEITAVAGKNKHPLFQELISQAKDGDVKWNFEKFLVGKNGKLVARYRSSTKPEDKDVIAKIETLIKQN
jgi:glutathione peroxidase